MENKERNSVYISGFVFVLFAYLYPTIFNSLLFSNIHTPTDDFIIKRALGSLVLFVPAIGIAIINTIRSLRLSLDTVFNYLLIVKFGMALYYLMYLTIVSNNALDDIFIGHFIFTPYNFVFLLVFCSFVLLLVMLPLSLSFIVRSIRKRECSLGFGVIFAIAQFFLAFDAVFVLLYAIKKHRFKKLSIVLVSIITFMVLVTGACVAAEPIVHKKRIEAEQMKYEMLKIYPSIENSSSYYTQNPITPEEYIVGTSIEFGAYRNNPLIWTVVAVEEDRALLFLSDVLRNENDEPEELLFHNEEIPITWAECSLRQWLNGEFYNNAFGEDNAAILMVTNENDDHEEHYVFENMDTWVTEYTDYYSYGGSDTDDYVFLISESEIETYSNLEELYTELYLNYFLRDLYGNNLRVRRVNYCNLHDYGLSYPDGVRPAVWININYFIES